MEEKFNERLGKVAGVLTTVSFLPQVWLVWGHFPEPATDISLGMFSILCFGISLWLVYGFRIRDRPLIISNSITFFLAASILLYKLVYG